MLILSVENQIVNTDHMKVDDQVHAAILSFSKNPKEPDFYFEMIEYLEEYSCASITLRIGEYEAVVPLHWSIMCTEMETLQTIPLVDVGGKNHPVFCLNPIDGFSPEFLRLRTSIVYPSLTWTVPQMNDKDLLVVPLVKPKKPAVEGVVAKTGTDDTPVVVAKTSDSTQHSDFYGRTSKGPLCAMFCSSKFEVYRPIADIW